MDEYDRLKQQKDTILSEQKTEWQKEIEQLKYEKGILVHMIEDGNIIRDSLKAENERLRKVEEKARAVCEERKNIFTNYPNVNHKLTIAFHELQDALKGGS